MSLARRKFKLGIGMAVLLTLAGLITTSLYQRITGNMKKRLKQLDSIPQIIEAQSNLEIAVVNVNADLQDYKTNSTRRFWTNFAPLEDRVLVLEQRK